MWEMKRARCHIWRGMFEPISVGSLLVHICCFSTAFFVASLAIWIKFNMVSKFIVRYVKYAKPFCIFCKYVYSLSVMYSKTFF